MNTSACMITWNEETTLPVCLKFLDSIHEIAEICIVDSFSDDATEEIVEDFKTKTDKVVKFEKHKFEDFATQRNHSLDLAEKEWIFSIDADETFSSELNMLLSDLRDLREINAVRIYTVVTYPDFMHYVKKPIDDPQIRVWRNGFARLQNEIHEKVVDVNGRNLFMHNAPDIIYCNGNKYQNVIRKHHQLLKDREVLLQKGQRWKEIGACDASCRAGIPINEGYWASNLDNYAHAEVTELPNLWRDVTTEMLNY